MMNFFLKVFFYFAINFLILSIPINNKPIFEHLSHKTAPYTEEFFHKLQYQIKKIYNKSIHFGTQFFSNTIPKEWQTIDDSGEDGRYSKNQFPDLIETIELNQ